MNFLCGISVRTVPVVETKTTVEFLDPWKRIWSWCPGISIPCFASRNRQECHANIIYKTVHWMFKSNWITKTLKYLVSEIHCI